MRNQKSCIEVAYGCNYFSISLIKIKHTSEALVLPQNFENLRLSQSCFRNPYLILVKPRKLSYISVQHSLKTGVAKEGEGEDVAV